MPMARITKVSGETNLYHIHVLDGHQGLPTRACPARAASIPATAKPARPDRPDHELPGGGRPGIPSNELPETPPPNLLPGYTLVLVRDQRGKWEYAAIAPGSPPPRPLPPPSRPDRPDQGLPGGNLRPDNSLPGDQPHPGQSLPGSPVAPDQGLPPTAQPKR